MAGMVFTLKVGDTVPIVQATLYDEAGDPLPLNGATVLFVMWNAFQEVVVEAEADVIDEAGAVVRYEWVAGNTDNPGLHAAHFVVTYPDGSEQTVPARARDNIAVLIDP